VEVKNENGIIMEAMDKDLQDKVNADYLKMAMLLKQIREDFKTKGVENLTLVEHCWLKDINDIFP